MRIQDIIGKRIAESRKKQKLTLKVLSQLTQGAHSPSCIANWESGTRMPGPEAAILLGGLLQVAPSYLLGLSDDEAGNVFMKLPEFVSAPLLTAEQAVDAQESIQFMQKEDPDHIHRVPFVNVVKNNRHNDNKHCFALVIPDESMAPTIITGNIVIVDPNQKPKPGGLVAAKIAGQPGVIIRQYKQHGFNASFEAFELIAFNGNWANIIVDSPDIADIVGTICQATHIYS